MFWMCIRIASVRRFYYTSTTYDFMEKYRNFSPFIILIPTPDFPHFYFILGENLGSLLYRDVSVMFNRLTISIKATDTMHFYHLTITLSFKTYFYHLTISLSPKIYFYHFTISLSLKIYFHHFTISLSPKI